MRNRRRNQIAELTELQQHPEPDEPSFEGWLE
jgi:hypothetical protein